MPSISKLQETPVMLETKVSSKPRAGLRVGLAEVALLGSIVFAASGHLLIKEGLNVTASATMHEAIWLRLLAYLGQPSVFLGLCVYGIGTLAWIFAVSKREISYLFPLTALNYVVVALGGRLLFDESIPLKRWAGILVVVCGVVLMNRSSEGGTE
jgi:drug/metabolite transporter (DMT)-like permease